MDAVGLLGQDVHPAPLVAAREAGVGPAPGHPVQHGDVLRHPDRVLGGEHDAELAHPDALGLEPHEQVEEHGVVGDLEALQVEVVFGEADGVVAELVGQLSLLQHLGQHAVVEVAAQPRPPPLDLGPAPDGRQVEERDLHGGPSTPQPPRR